MSIEYLLSTYNTLLIQNQNSFLERNGLTYKPFPTSRYYIKKVKWFLHHKRLLKAKPTLLRLTQVSIIQGGLSWRSVVV